jgi:hypothetical protein
LAGDLSGRHVGRYVERVFAVAGTLGWDA